MPNEQTESGAQVPCISLLAEVRSYIAFGLRQRDSEKIGGNEAKVMYWTGYIFAMRTVENSMEREANISVRREPAASGGE